MIDSSYSARQTVNGRVRRFPVVLLAETGGRLRCLTRYDTAHGYPHQDIRVASSKNDTRASKKQGYVDS